MSYNPGLLFYKHYYGGIKFDPTQKEKNIAHNKKVFDGKNKELLKTPFNGGMEIMGMDNLLSFAMTTTYPGLIIGTGYAHGSGLEGEFKTGFYFDYTTGMPVISGSSVKGLLRSAFPGRYREKASSLKEKNPEAAASWEKLAQNRKNFILALLKALNIPDSDVFPVEKLEREIFESMHGTDRENKDDHFSMRYSDVFFDAVLQASNDDLIFDDEFITPHKNPLKNPVPLQLLKVRPGVTFAFQFRLTESYKKKEDNAEMTPRLLTSIQRLELFRQILLFLGAGAKTNTGFGHFEDTGRVDLAGIKKLTGQAETAEPEPEKRQPEPAPKTSARIDISKVRRGNTVDGLVVKKENGVLYIQLDVDGYTGEVSCKYPSDRIQAGQRVRLRVNNVEGKGDKTKIIVADPVLI